MDSNVFKVEDVTLDPKRYDLPTVSLTRADGYGGYLNITGTGIGERHLTDVFRKGKLVRLTAAEVPDCEPYAGESPCPTT